MESERTGMWRRGTLRLVRMRREILLSAAVAVLWAVPAFGLEPARLLLLSPSDEEIREQVDLPGDVLIAVSILDPDAQVDLPTVRLYVDDRDVTPAATVTSAVVTYVPSPPLTPGRHRFDLRLKDTAGNDLPGLRRDFRVEGMIQEEAPWGIQGRVALESLSDDLSGPGAHLRQQPDQTSTARVQLGGYAGEWKYRGALFLTSDEDKAYQPRNRYQFHLDHGWVGLDVGDVNYTFSPMVLRGKRTRGVGGYMRMGAVELTALRGSIRRGIEGDVQTDTATGDTTAITGATFERNLVGARVAVGSGRLFQVALDGVRVRDELGSIDAGLLPKDNLVVGSGLLLAPFKRRIILDASAALSFITEDITGGAISEQEIRDLAGQDVNVPFEPTNYEDLFIINLSTRPLDPRDLSSLAFQSGLKGNLHGHVFETRYQRVGPSFASLAAPSILSDKKGMRATDTFRLLRKRLRIFGEYEQFHDNLNDDKDFTTDTRIVGVSTSYVPGRRDLQQVTLSLRQYNRENDAPAPEAGGSDYRVDDRTNSFRVGAGYHVGFHGGHDLSAAYLRSKTDALSESADAEQTDWNLGWVLQLEGLPLMLETGFGRNSTEYPFDGTYARFTTLRMRGTYTLLQGRLETNASVARIAGESNRGVVGGDKLSIDAGARYRLAEKTYVSGRLGTVDFSDEADSDNDYRETILNLRLVQDF